MPLNAPTMNSTTEYYVDQYQAFAGKLPGRQLGWLDAQRSADLARFEQVGLPTQQDENWRYTTIRPITGKTFAAATATRKTNFNLEPQQIRGLNSHRLVFVDGIFAPDLSDRSEPAAGVTVDSLARVLEHRPELVERNLGSVKPQNAHGFTALNNAYSQDGVVVVLAPHASPAVPLEMLFISHEENTFAQPRNLVIAGNDSKTRIIERYVSVNGHSTLTNSTTEIVLGEKAEIDYYLVQTQSAEAYHVCGIWAKQSTGSRFSCRTVTLGGALVRNDLGAELAGEQAHCDMLGLYSIAGKQHVDNHTTVIHGAENCTSHELYKGVLDQRSRAVFHGRIKVKPGAQKTDAEQANHNLLLSRNAEIDTKPQLEIYADDVKCSHGATVGQIDEDSLFYLRSRGIEEADARSLLTFAFVNDVISEIQISELGEDLQAVLAERLINKGHE